MTEEAPPIQDEPPIATSEDVVSSGANATANAEDVVNVEGQGGDQPVQYVRPSIPDGGTTEGREEEDPPPPPPADPGREEENGHPSADPAEQPPAEEENPPEEEEEDFTLDKQMMFGELAQIDIDRHHAEQLANKLHNMLFMELSCTYPRGTGVGAKYLGDKIENDEKEGKQATVHGK